MKLPTNRINRLFQLAIKSWHGRDLYRYQERIAFAILSALVDSQEGKTVEIPIKLPRQSGKTTGVVDAVEFALAGAVRYFGRPLRIGIFAPQTEQATTDFDRLKDQVLAIRKLGFRSRVEQTDDLRIPEKWNSKTIKLYTRSQVYLGEVYIFPLNKNSNPESKTLDLIIVEESQLIDDDKLKNAVFPMGASTNAPRIYIGTGGYRPCMFKHQLETNPMAITITLEEVLEERRAVAKLTGDVRHLLYERFVNHEIEVYGKDSDYIRTQYKGEWLVGVGNFTTKEELVALKGTHFIIDENQERDDPKHRGQKLEPHAVYVGIDSAKSPDSTVVTVQRHIEERNVKQLVSWLELEGENYEDQFEYIKSYLDNFENIIAIAIDSTGQGSFMPDKFERHSPWEIIPVVFSVKSKDIMGRNLQQVIKNKYTELPVNEYTKEYGKFMGQMLDLQKEYKGEKMVLHHPEGTNDSGQPFHDDYCQSWALAEYAFAIKQADGVNVS